MVVVWQLIKEQEQKILRTQKCRQLGVLTLLTQERSASSYWFLKLLLNPSFQKIYFAASGFMADLSYHNQMKRIQLLEIYISSGLSIKDAWGPISDFQLFDDAPNCCVRFFGFFYSLSILQSRWVLRFVPRLHIIPMTPLKPQSLTRGSDCSCVCMAPRQRPGNPKSKIKIICALLKHTLHPKPYPLLNNNIQSELWETLRTPQNVPAQTVSRPHNPILGRLWPGDDDGDDDDECS